MSKILDFILILLRISLKYKYSKLYSNLYLETRLKY